MLKQKKLKLLKPGNQEKILSIEKIILIAFIFVNLLNTFTTLNQEG